MSVALQVRDVPDDIRDALAEHAARQGKSLQTYLLDVLRREARFARNTEAFERTAVHRVAIPDELNPERIVREGRDGGFGTDRNAA